MKIASNKIADMLVFYREYLREYYEPGELQALIELVFYHYVNFSRSDLILKQQENLNQSDILKLYDACKALASGIPVQYVLGETEFYGLRFRVSPSVLIPRPETEELVDLILKECPVPSRGYHALDIGTGSGCIPVSLKHRWPSAAVYGLDISEAALETARGNAQLNGAEVHFIKSDILNPQRPAGLTNLQFDLVVSNPPYILEQEAVDMEPRVKDHEPSIALFVDDTDPIVFYKRIIDFCKEYLKPGGMLYFELNPATAPDVKQYAESVSIFCEISLLKDLSGKQRFLKAKKN